MHLSDEEIGSKTIVKQLKTFMDNRIVRSMIKALWDQKELEKSLGILSGVEKPNCFSERVKAKLLEWTLLRISKKLGIEEDKIRTRLKPKYLRKGMANVIIGIAENGITMPQVLHAPFLVVWDFTKQCNLMCKHCYINAVPHPSEDELSLEEKLDVVDQLDRAGVAAIAFSGGEPLMNKDFWEVAEYANEKGFFLSIASNGTLITKEVAERLKSVGVRYAEISLDSPYAEKHDSFRGIPGAFNRTVEGIRNVVKVGIDVGIAITSTKINKDDVLKMVDLSRSLGASKLIVFNFVPTGRGEFHLDLNPWEREELLRNLFLKWNEISNNCGLEILSTSPTYSRIGMEISSGPVSPTHFVSIDSKELEQIAEFLGGCGAGRLYCSIEPNGDVQPCVFMPIKLGNVLIDGFENIWKKNNLLKTLRNRDLLKGGCSSCRYKYVCGGCRARAYSYFRDPMAPDPGCIYNSEYWEKLTKGGK